MEVNCKVLQCKIITHEDIFKVCYYNSPYIFKTLLRLYSSSILEESIQFYCQAYFCSFSWNINRSMLKSNGDFQISSEIFIFTCSEINIVEAVFNTDYLYFIEHLLSNCLIFIWIEFCKFFCNAVRFDSDEDSIFTVFLKYNMNIILNTKLKFKRKMAKDMTVVI